MALDFRKLVIHLWKCNLTKSKQTLQDEINTIFHSRNNFYDTFKETIYQIVKAFETALNSDLLLEKEKRNYFFEFDVK